MTTTQAKPLTKKAQREQEREESRQELLKILRPGDRVYSVIRSVARSGMSRTIDFYAMQVDDRDGKPFPRYLTGYIADVLDYRRDDHGALKVGGCGMDMCFHVVYNVGRALWPRGTDKPHGTRNGSPDSDGGYALKSERL